MAFDAVAAERDRLAGQNATLTEQLVRVVRREAGMPEVPRAARRKLEPMSETLREYIAGFASRSLQKAMRDSAYKEHASGTPWSEIEARITQPEEPIGECKAGQTAGTGGTGGPHLRPA